MAGCGAEVSEGAGSLAIIDNSSDMAGYKYGIMERFWRIIWNIMYLCKNIGINAYIINDNNLYYLCYSD